MIECKQSHAYYVPWKTCIEIEHTVKSNKKIYLISMHTSFFAYIIAAMYSCLLIKVLEMLHIIGCIKYALGARHDADVKYAVRLHTFSVRGWYTLALMYFVSILQTERIISEKEKKWIDMCGCARFVLMHNNHGMAWYGIAWHHLAYATQITIVHRITSLHVQLL